MSFPETFVLFDLEYTAWEGSQERQWSGENEHREVLQIGAVRVAGSDLQEIGSFLVYVKPVRNPILSEYIVSITGITQDDIEKRGVVFKDALEQLAQFVDQVPAYCWGSDVEVLRENCQLNGFAVPGFMSHLTNMRPLLVPVFESIGVDTKKYSSGTLISAFTKTNEPRRAHDALNDMRNLREAIVELKKAL